MLIPNNYEINVSLNGQHFCKIELGSIPVQEVESKFKILRDHLKGFTLNLYKISCFGTHVIIDGRD